jgi:hypothetical protein
MILGVRRLPPENLEEGVRLATACHWRGAVSTVAEFTIQDHAEMIYFGTILLGTCINCARPCPSDLRASWSYIARQARLARETLRQSIAD